MRIKTTHRYLVWQSSDQCISVDSPNLRLPGGGRSWLTRSGEIVYWKREPQLDHISPKEFDDRVYDTESEEDMKILQALMEL